MGRVDQVGVGRVALDVPGDERALRGHREASAPEVVEDIRATLHESATIFQEGVIKPGLSAELDQHRALTGDARQWIAALEVRERERTGVRGARVGYTINEDGAKVRVLRPSGKEV